MPLCTQYFIDKLLEVLVPAPLAQRVAALEAALLAARADERLEQPVGQFDRWKAEERGVASLAVTHAAAFEAALVAARAADRKASETGDSEWQTLLRSPFGGAGNA